MWARSIGGAARRAAIDGVKKVVDACVTCAERGYNAGSGLPMGNVMARYCNHIVAINILYKFMYIYIYIYINVYIYIYIYT